METITTISVLSGLAVIIIMTLLGIFRKPRSMFSHVMYTISLSICVGLLVNMTLIIPNNYNGSYLSEYTDYVDYKVTKSDESDLFGHIYEFVLTYEDNSKLKGSLTIGKEKPFTRLGYSFSLYNINGNQVYSVWREANVEFRNRIINEFVDKHKSKYESFKNK